MQIFESFLYQIPHLLLYVGGIIFAMTRMKRAKAPALLVIVSLSTMLLTSLFFTVVQAYLVTTIGQNGGGNSILMLRGIGVVHSIIRVFALALLIYAVFVGRNPAPHSDD